MPAPPARDDHDALPPHCDPRRWEELISSLRPAAMRTVIASAMSPQVRSACTPEDVWQETLAMAWRDRGQHRWSGVSAFRAWLFEIARNRIRGIARGVASQKRGASRRLQSLGGGADAGSGSVLVPQPADSVTPSRIIARSEKQVAVEQALARVPTELREIVRLHLVDEMAMEAIAQRLGLGVSAAWRRFRKGVAMCERFLPGRPQDGSSLW